MKFKVLLMVLMGFFYFLYLFVFNTKMTFNDFEQKIKSESFYGQGVKFYNDQQNSEMKYIAILVKSESQPDLNKEYIFLQKYIKIITDNKFKVSGIALSIIYNNKNYGIIIGNKFFNKYSNYKTLSKNCHNLSYLGNLSETCTLSPEWKF